MTKRDGFTECTYQDLLDAVERREESAIQALKVLQELRAKNETYVIRHSPQYGWRVDDQIDESRPVDDTQPMRRPRGK